MKAAFFTLSIYSIISLYSQAFAQTLIPPADVQIKLALLAAPAEKQTGATVLGYSPAGEVVTLKKGSNEMICLADTPGDDGFSVSCYHQSLEPFMSRGRALRKEGKNFQDIFDIREKEAKSGTLAMPAGPASLFVYTAPKEAVNLTSGEVEKGYLRYVVYIPYATVKSTGLPLKPEGPAMPWLMYPGTHAAHIMINPAKE